MKVFLTCNSILVFLVQVAASIALPRVAVDVRHDGTHNTLPSAHVLRVAAEECLKWIDENYLIPQGSKVTEVCAREAQFVQRDISFAAKRALTVPTGVTSLRIGNAPIGDCPGTAIIIIIIIIVIIISMCLFILSAGGFRSLMLPRQSAKRKMRAVPCDPEPTAASATKRKPAVGAIKML